MVSTKLFLLLAATAAPALAFESFMGKIPNGAAMGMKLGHADKGYTPFGSLFKEKGNTWAGVCKEMWPGQSEVSVGAVLGDPCCKWTTGTPDFELSAPFLAGKECASDAKPTTTPDQTPAPAQTPAPGGGKPGPVPAPAPVPAPGGGKPGASGNGTVAVPTPAPSKPSGKPHKLCV